MTKDEFEKIFNTSLDLKSKNWKYVALGRAKNSFVSISELGEITKDFLYYDYGHKIWEVDLDQWLEDELFTLRDAMKVALSTKANYSDNILFKELPHLKHNHVEINLNVFGKVIELPKSNSKKSPIVGKSLELDNIAEVIEKAYAKNKVELFDHDLETYIQKTSKFRGRPKEDLLLDKLTTDLLEVSEKINTKEAIPILERMSMTITLLKKFIND